MSPKEIEENAIRLIGDRWMLVTAGDENKFNTMTASWGGIGYLWNKPVAFVFVRPERYTFEFTERFDYLTLTFFAEEYRPALKLCGTVSGRTVNKTEESGLTPKKTTMGNIYFEEASLVLECKKIYAEFLNPESFTDVSSMEKWYMDGGLHKMYIVEIVNAWKK